MKKHDIEDLAEKRLMTHVLIAEDHEENRNLLKLLLEANGYRVTVAGDGLETLAAARRDSPDAIVSNVLMPKMDGFLFSKPVPAEIFETKYLAPPAGG